ncbi:MAG: hypothetical protein HY619_00140, partial [Thaumarchaeota archaeon]|nr:hypothetical protein [Nitrososphaerota archaeon]
MLARYVESNMLTNYATVMNEIRNAVTVQDKVSRLQTLGALSRSDRTLVNQQKTVLGIMDGLGLDNATKADMMNKFRESTPNIREQILVLLGDGETSDEVKREILRLVTEVNWLAAAFNQSFWLNTAAQQTMLQSARTLSRVGDPAARTGILNRLRQAASPALLFDRMSLLGALSGGFTYSHIARLNTELGLTPELAMELLGIAPATQEAATLPPTPELAASESLSVPPAEEPSLEVEVITLAEATAQGELVSALRAIDHAEVVNGISLLGNEWQRLRALQFEDKDQFDRKIYGMAVSIAVRYNMAKRAYVEAGLDVTGLDQIFYGTQGRRLMNEEEWIVFRANRLARRTQNLQSQQSLLGYGTELTAAAATPSPLMEEHVPAIPITPPGYETRINPAAAVPSPLMEDHAPAIPATSPGYGTELIAKDFIEGQSGTLPPGQGAPSGGGVADKGPMAADAKQPVFNREANQFQADRTKEGITALIGQLLARAINGDKGAETVWNYFLEEIEKVQDNWSSAENWPEDLREARKKGIADMDNVLHPLVSRTFDSFGLPRLQAGLNTAFKNAFEKWFIEFVEESRSRGLDDLLDSVPEEFKGKFSLSDIVIHANTEDGIFKIENDPESEDDRLILKMHYGVLLEWFRSGRDPLLILLYTLAHELPEGFAGKVGWDGRIVGDNAHTIVSKYFPEYITYPGVLDRHTMEQIPGAMSQAFADLKEEAGKGSQGPLSLFGEDAAWTPVLFGLFEAKKAQGQVWKSFKSSLRKVMRDLKKSGVLPKSTNVDQFIRDLDAATNIESLDEVFSSSQLILTHFEAMEVILEAAGFGL